jgi:hypothetical protein
MSAYVKRLKEVTINIAFSLLHRRTKYIMPYNPPHFHGAGYRAGQKLSRDKFSVTPLQQHEGLYNMHFPKMFEYIRLLAAIQLHFFL